MKFFLILLMILSVFIIKDIPQNFIPHTEIPEIQIKIKCNGCPRSKLEGEIIEPWRTEILKISGVSSVEAESKDQNGIIRVLFIFGTPIDQMKIWLNESFDKMIDRFPPEVSRPLIVETDLNLQPAISLLLFSSLESENIRELERSLESLESVSYVTTLGQSTSGFEITPNYNLLGNLKIRPEEIKKSILQETQIQSDIFDLFEGKRIFEFTISSIPNLELESILIKDIPLSEIASIKKKEFLIHGEVIHNGKKAILLQIFKRPDVGYFALNQEIDQWIIQNSPKWKLKIERNYSGFILETLESLKISLGVAVLLTFILILFFYQNLEISLTAILILITSIVLSVGVLGLFSFSINIISLTGLMFSTGLMIDNSIIYVDQLSGNSSSKIALRKKVQKIFPALLTSSFTTVGVFLPIIFLPGIFGFLLGDLVKTIGLGIFISLSLNYLLFPYFFEKLKFPTINSSLSFDLIKGYEKLLTRLLSKKYLVRILYLVCFIISIIIIKKIPVEWIPDLNNQYKTAFLRSTIQPSLMDIKEWTWINGGQISEMRINGEVKEDYKEIEFISDDPISKIGDFLKAKNYVLIPDTTISSNNRLNKDLKDQLKWLNNQEFQLSNGQPVLILGSENTEHTLQLEYPEGNWIYSSEMNEINTKEDNSIRVIKDGGIYFKTNEKEPIQDSITEGFEIIKNSVWGVIILFLALYTHFRKIIYPFILMAELPISIAGSLIFLWIGGSSMNIMSVAGILVSLGIVVNDSILKLDAIQQNSKNGMSLIASVKKAGKQRVIPIILTSLTTIIAIIPSLWGKSSGHFLQYPLALSLAGGMVFSTFSSLFILPKWIIYLKSV